MIPRLLNQFGLACHTSYTSFRLQSARGFSYYHDSLISFHNVAVEITAIVFMLISSMNFSLYYKLWRGDWQAVKQDSEHRYYLALILVATALICGDLYLHDYMNFAQSLLTRSK